MQIRIALPKGRLLTETAKLAAAAGWQLSDYSENARLYHMTSTRFPELSAKILHEKDIPIQVAMGNYDLGICGLDWLQELLMKYPESGLVKLKDLGYGALELFLAAGRSSPFTDLKKLCSTDQVISIASEYSSLAESMALNCRFKHFNIFPVWGAAEIYPPENSDLVLLPFRTGKEMSIGDLVPVVKVMDSTAHLIANKSSWENKDLTEILNTLYVKPEITPSRSSPVKIITSTEKNIIPATMSAGSAAVAGEVGVVENVVIEAVGGEEVAAVVGLVECPVVAQALGHQHQHAVVPKLVIFDNGESLEGFAEADAVGNDAAAQPLQLVDGPDDAVPLELEELLPDSGVADAGGGFDDTLFVQFVTEVFENVEEGQVVDERRGFRIGEFLKTREECDLLLIGGGNRIPKARKPRA